MTCLKLEGQASLDILAIVALKLDTELKQSLREYINLEFDQDHPNTTHSIVFKGNTYKNHTYMYHSETLARLEEGFKFLKDEIVSKCKNKDLYVSFRQNVQIHYGDQDKYVLSVRLAYIPRT